VLFGATVLRHEVVGSTQDVARELAAGGVAPGTVVTARFQTWGRGRRGRVWHAPPDANVCLTAIGPPVKASVAWQIALVAGLAACDAVRKAAPALDARVRFPNDVTAGGKKVGGVLVETAPFAASADAVVPLIGIGINVRAAPLPPDVAVLATSLEVALGTPVEISAVESTLLRQLSLAWDEWTWNGFAATLARWKTFADPAARRTFVLDGRPTRCRVADLAQDGTLTLETDTSDVCKLNASTVVLGDD